MADVYLSCGDDLDVEVLLRLLAVDSSGDAYIDCTNDEFSAEDLLKMLIVEDADGNPAIAVYGTNLTTTTKADLESVTSGVAYPVTFATPFADALYSLSIYIHDVAGGNVSFTLNTRSANGFTITPIADGTMHWIAVRT